MAVHNRKKIMEKATLASVVSVPATDQDGRHSKAKYASTTREIGAAAAVREEYMCDLCPRTFPTE